MRDFDRELAEYGLTRQTFEQCLEDIKNKYLGINDLDWKEIVDKYNLDIHYDTLRKASQTVFGNVFVAEYFAEKKATDNIDSDKYLEELKELRRELQKEKQKIRDERTDYQKTVREAARQEEFIEIIENTFKKNIEPLGYKPSPKVDSDNDMVVCLSDMHAGMEVKNWWNSFNIDILKERLHKYLDSIIEIQSLHKCKECKLVLGGDEISGIIHTSLRVQNNEDVIQQLKLVIEFIGEFIIELQNHFEKIDVYGVAGNHSRIMPNKEDSLNGENLEEMLLYCLDLKFKNNPNVEICEYARIDNTICCMKTRGGKLFYIVHGDKDSVGNVVQNLTLMTGIKPDGIIMGHRHHNALETVHGVKVIQCGCVVGADDYCIDRRITGKPEQVCFITNNTDAVKCLYDVTL